MREHFTFSSGALAEDAAFERYAALYALGADVRRTPAPFRAEVRAWRMDRLILFDRRLSGVEHRRDTRIESDGFSHFVLTAVVSGHVCVRLSQEEAMLGPGDLLIVDTRQPASTEPLDAHIMTVSVSREVVESALAGRRRPHGVILRSPEPAPLLGLLAGVVANAEGIPVSATPNLCRAFLETLAAIVSGDADRSALATSRRDSVQRAAVRNLVRSRLDDPDLTAEVIAEVTGMSRASLYRLLGRDGGVKRYVRAQRIDAARALLDEDPDVSTGAVAKTVGYASEDRLTADFDAVLGVGLDAYRDAIREAAARGDGSLARFRWSFWMRELE